MLEIDPIYVVDFVESFSIFISVLVFCVDIYLVMAEERILKFLDVVFRVECEAVGHLLVVHLLAQCLLNFLRHHPDLLLGWLPHPGFLLHFLFGLLLFISDILLIEDVLDVLVVDTDRLDSLLGLQQLLYCHFILTLIQELSLSRVFGLSLILIVCDYFRFVWHLLI